MSLEFAALRAHAIQGPPANELAYRRIACRPRYSPRLTPVTSAERVYMTLLKLDACAHCGHPVDATSPHVYVDIKESTFERRAFCGAICVRAAYYTDARLLHSLWKGKIA